MRFYDHVGNAYTELEQFINASDTITLPSVPDSACYPANEWWLETYGGIYAAGEKSPKSDNDQHFHATAASYDPNCVTLSLTGNLTPSLSDTSLLTLVVEDILGQPMPGKTVNWSYKVKGANRTRSGGIGTTDSNGIVTYTLDNGNTQSTIQVTAALITGQTDTVEVKFGPTLNADFIAVDSTTPRSWGAAINFCAVLGGKLPLINAVTVLDFSTDISGEATAAIAGFGTVITSTSTAWPTDLPNFTYWTGTEDSNNDPLNLCLVGYNSGQVEITSVDRTGNYYVACVP